MNMFHRLIVLVLLLSALGYLSLYEHSTPQVAQGRFVKLDVQGKELTAWQGPWSCVLDKNTGLVWENKTDDESIHDALWTFSWHVNGVGVQNSGDCYFEEERCDTEDLMRRVNEKKLCGLDDWRLPSKAELNALVFETPKTGEAKIMADFFVHTKRGDYWTAEFDADLEGVYAHLKKGAIAIDFIEGKHRVIPYRNAAFVRLVSNRSDY